MEIVIRPAVVRALVNAQAVGSQPFASPVAGSPGCEVSPGMCAESPSDRSVEDVARPLMSGRISRRKYRDPDLFYGMGYRHPTSHFVFRRLALDDSDAESSEGKVSDGIFSKFDLDDAHADFEHHRSVIREIVDGFVAENIEEFGPSKFRCLLDGETFGSQEAVVRHMQKFHRAQIASGLKLLTEDSDEDCMGNFVSRLFYSCMVGRHVRRHGPVSARVAPVLLPKKPAAVDVAAAGLEDDDFPDVPSRVLEVFSAENIRQLERAVFKPDRLLDEILVAEQPNLLFSVTESAAERQKREKAVFECAKAHVDRQNQLADARVEAARLLQRKERKMRRLVEEEVAEELISDVAAALVKRIGTKAVADRRRVEAAEAVKREQRAVEEAALSHSQELRERRIAERKMRRELRKEAAQEFLVELTTDVVQEMLRGVAEGALRDYRAARAAAALVARSEVYAGATAKPRAVPSIEAISSGVPEGALQKAPYPPGSVWQATSAAGSWRASSDTSDDQRIVSGMQASLSEHGREGAAAMRDPAEVGRFAGRIDRAAEAAAPGGIGSVDVQQPGAEAAAPVRYRTNEMTQMFAALRTSPGHIRREPAPAKTARAPSASAKLPGSAASRAGNWGFDAVGHRSARDAAIDRASPRGDGAAQFSGRLSGEPAAAGRVGATAVSGPAAARAALFGDVLTTGRVKHQQDMSVSAQAVPSFAAPPYRGLDGLPSSLRAAGPIGAPLGASSPLPAAGASDSAAAVAKGALRTRPGSFDSVVRAGGAPGGSTAGVPVTSPRTALAGSVGAIGDVRLGLAVDGPLASASRPVAGVSSPLAPSYSLPDAVKKLPAAGMEGASLAPGGVAALGMVAEGRTRPASPPVAVSDVEAVSARPGSPSLSSDAGGAPARGEEQSAPSTQEQVDHTLPEDYGLRSELCVQVSGIPFSFNRRATVVQFFGDLRVAANTNGEPKIHFLRRTDNKACYVQMETAHDFEDALMRDGRAVSGETVRVSRAVQPRRSATGQKFAFTLPTRNVQLGSSAAAAAAGASAAGSSPHGAPPGLSPVPAAATQRSLDGSRLQDGTTADPSRLWDFSGKGSRPAGFHAPFGGGGSIWSPLSLAGRARDATEPHTGPRDLS